MTAAQFAEKLPSAWPLPSGFQGRFGSLLPIARRKMGTSVRGKNKLSEARAPVLRSKKRHSHCDLPIQTEDISRPREERDLGFFAVATPQWRAHAPPAHPAAHTSQ